MRRSSQTATALLAAIACCSLAAQETAGPAGKDAAPRDWNQWGGSPSRNNAPPGKDIPATWDLAKGTNVKWIARLGSVTYGTPVVAAGKVFIGTNNGGGRVERYPALTDLGVLLCFAESDGRFQWQHSSEKLPRGIDAPMRGVSSSPLVEGNRLWFVSTRCEVLCLDVEGYHDQEDDGPVKSAAGVPKDAAGLAEADVVWKLDMRAELGVEPHDWSGCSVTGAGDRLFVNTGNGVDAGHLVVPRPEAPSFLCLDKRTGKVLWSDNSPGANILHGQWSSPAYGVFAGVPQVVFAGGDGWLYGFDPAGENGKSKLLWKFDCNPKTLAFQIGRPTASRSHLVGTPVIYNERVYIAVGEDPDHGEGEGHLWCIDPRKRGDVSPTLVFNRADPTRPIPHKRLVPCEVAKGDFERDNPNSAAVWHYVGVDRNKNGKLDFEEAMHRTCGSVAIQDGLLYVADFRLLVHCVDAGTGAPCWMYDMLAACYGAPLVVDKHVFVCDEDGDVAVFWDSRGAPGAPLPVIENNLLNSIYGTPVVANNVLYIASRKHLFAIEQGAHWKAPSR